MRYLQGQDVLIFCYIEVAGSLFQIICRPNRVKPQRCMTVRHRYRSCFLCGLNAKTSACKNTRWHNAALKQFGTSQFTPCAPHQIEASSNFRCSPFLSSRCSYSELNLPRRSSSTTPVSRVPPPLRLSGVFISNGSRKSGGMSRWVSLAVVTSVGRAG